MYTFIQFNDTFWILVIKTKCFDTSLLLSFWISALKLIHTVHIIWKIYILILVEKRDGKVFFFVVFYSASSRVGLCMQISWFFDPQMQGCVIIGLKLHRFHCYIVLNYKRSEAKLLEFTSVAKNKTSALKKKTASAVLSAHYSSAYISLHLPLNF